MADRFKRRRRCIAINICIVTDNEYLYEYFVKLTSASCYQNCEFDFFFSARNNLFLEKYKNTSFRPIRLKEKDESFFSQYDIFFSLHSKQIFPSELVNRHVCINVHPGYNPYNRGWYPQVFSIINKKPVGVTIHLMDEHLDHGPILFQREVAVFEHDTSFDVYQRILMTETAMLTEYLPAILRGEYTALPMHDCGNLNTKQDFADLCRIDLQKHATYGEVIDYLRAMTFEGYRNAFFTAADGRKIYVTLNLEAEADQQ